MTFINCTKCNKQITNESEKCPHCGTSHDGRKIKKQKKWHERTSVTLCVAAMLIIVGLGFIHIITGVVSSYHLPFDIALKKSFGYRETFIDARKITSIPYLAAKIKYPIGCEVLQRLGYIESGSVFETAMTEQLREAINIWQAEFEEALDIQNQLWQNQLRGKTESPDITTGNPDNYNNRGIDAAIKGRYETAISEFTRACRKNPEHADAYYNRGLVYVAIGQTGKAISDFTEVIEIIPEFVEAYIHKGKIHVTMRQYDQAIQDFTKAIEIAPERAEIYFRRALACFAQGKYDDAWQDVHKIQSMELTIPPGFLYNLRRVSGTEQ
jgi:tetratricopeptide (TPR) repeat protein